MATAGFLSSAPTPGCMVLLFLYICGTQEILMLELYSSSSFIETCSIAYK